MLSCVLLLSYQYDCVTLDNRTTSQGLKKASQILELEYSLSYGSSLNVQKRCPTVASDEHAPNDSPAATTQAMVESLEDALGAGTQLWRRVVGDVAAAGGPDRGVRYALHELEGQHPPRVLQP